MKYLVIVLALTLIGCTSADTTRAIFNELQESRMNLQSCQNSLEAYRSGSDISSGGTMQPDVETQNEPEQPSEPQYETVLAFHIQTKLGNTVCYSRNDTTSSNEQDIPCGMTFNECKDGYIYRCMVDVKYKIVEEQKLIEQEN